MNGSILPSLAYSINALLHCSAFMRIGTPGTVFSLDGQIGWIPN